MRRDRIAKKCRLLKAKNPAAWCPRAGCLWRLKSGRCPKHGLYEPPKSNELRASEHDGGGDRQRGE